MRVHPGGLSVSVASTLQHLNTVFQAADAAFGRKVLVPLPSPIRTTDDHRFRFGRTLVYPTAASPFDVRAEGVVAPTNRRGVMGVGVSGTIRQRGGAEIEREAMQQGPIALGDVVVTSAGALQDLGVTRVIHAAIADSLGSPTREVTVRHATSAILAAADREKLRSMAMPVLRSGQSLTVMTSEKTWLIMIEEILAYLRRHSSRMDRLLLLAHDEREAGVVNDILAEARHRWWVVRS